MGIAFLSASSSVAFSLDIPEPKDRRDLKEAVLARVGLPELPSRCIGIVSGYSHFTDIMSTVN